MHYKLNWGICFVIFWMNWRQEKIFWYFLTFKVVQETPLLHLQFNLKFYCRVLLTCYSYSAQSKTVWWVIAKLINIILLRAVRVRERGHMPPPPVFSRSVYPISARRAGYAHQITTCPLRIFRSSDSPESCNHNRKMNILGRPINYKVFCFYCTSIFLRLLSVVNM